MKIRYIAGVTAGLLTAGLLGGVIGVAVDNGNKNSTLGRLRGELNDKTNVPVPPESRILSNEYSPAYPSPGYEN